MIKVINDGGRPWVVRLVFSGDKYGLDFKLVHDKDEPLVEFYDGRHEHTDYGQFVSRYYADTLLKGFQPGATGLCLDGGIPEWTIGRQAYLRILIWMRKIVNNPTPADPNAPIERKWLSQYIGDMQQAWSEGDLHRVDDLLHSSEFNDRIYYTS